MTYRILKERNSWPIWAYRPGAKCITNVTRRYNLRPRKSIWLI